MKIFWSACTFVGLFALLAACADSANNPTEEQSIAARSAKAQVWIEKDGCTVYRYKANSMANSVYWTKCDNGHSSASFTTGTRKHPTFIVQ